MNAKMIKTKKPFVSPSCELVVFECKDVLTVSGGFDGEWDADI